MPLSKLPRVVLPGQGVGAVSPLAADMTGILMGTPIIAGASDGTASFFASGAAASGDWNITIGTTIAMRGMSADLVRDPAGRIYCHRHPESYWLPGGASNVGGEALAQVFGAHQLRTLDDAAFARGHSRLAVYPLARQGERMPFVSADAQGFEIDTDPAHAEPIDEIERFAGYAEGVAMVAAWSLQEAAALGAPVDGDYFITGGGAHGKTLRRALANLLNRPLIVPREPDAAFGSALLAASWAWHRGSVSAAQRAMVERADVIAPQPDETAYLQEKLERLKAECRQRGFL